MTGQFDEKFLAAKMELLGFSDTSFGKPRMLGGKVGMLGKITFIDMTAKDPEDGQVKFYPLALKVNTDRKEYAEIVTGLGLSETEIATYDTILKV